MGWGSLSSIDSWRLIIIHAQTIFSLNDTLTAQLFIAKNPTVLGWGEYNLVSVGDFGGGAVPQTGSSEGVNLDGVTTVVAVLELLAEGDALGGGEDGDRGAKHPAVLVSRLNLIEFNEFNEGAHNLEHLVIVGVGLVVAPSGEENVVDLRNVRVVHKE